MQYRCRFIVAGLKISRDKEGEFYQKLAGLQFRKSFLMFLSRSISPAVNHRTDDWGGSLENRARILLEMMKGIRKNEASFHITVKINSSDFTYDGNTEVECIAIYRQLDNAGIDSIEISGNGTSVRQMRSPTATMLAHFTHTILFDGAVYRACGRGEQKPGSVLSHIAITQVHYHPD